MSDRKITLALLGYAAASIITFGHAAAQGEIADAERYAECKASDPKRFCAGLDTAGLDGFLGGLLWPLYWSWEAWS